MMRLARLLVLGAAASAALIVPGRAAAPEAKHMALESVEGLRLQNVSAVPETFKGKKGLRITPSTEAQGMSSGQQTVEQLAIVEGLEFSNGVIEAEVAGAPGPGAFEGARGFVGIAFRVQADTKHYDGFFLRPTNGRADDQERRNHSVQYISHPDWTWSRLRTETPSKYEAYVDLVSDEWTKMKIEVHGDKARLYVHDNEQPTMIVNDVKSGAQATGRIGLWLGPGTVAHFRDLRIQPQP
jgi:hypothetical protein